ncbi:MAG: transposase [bacterium]
MPRQVRRTIPNVPYHMTQRGNNGRDVFFSNDDRKRYLKWMIHYSSRYEFDIIAYCLMTTHVHFVGIPRKTNSIAMTVQVVHMIHTQAINKESNLKGHLWHSPYYSSPMDDKHMWLAIRYVEQNPVRAGIVHHPTKYKWSSARAHCGLSDDPVLAPGVDLPGVFDGWSEILKEIPDVEAIESIKNCTLRGLPCGENGFVKRISSRMGLKTNKRKRGRPQKPVK